MLQTQRSLKSRFRAISTSMLLMLPAQFGDRLELLFQSVINDSLSDLEFSDLEFSDLELVQKLDLSIVAIAIGAYWHHDLREVRSRILELQSHSAADISELVLAYTIAIGCQGELHPRSLIKDIDHHFSPRRSLSRDPAAQPKCLAQLKLAQKLVDEGASAITARQQLDPDDRSIASSLYYFLSTPHSWSLVTQRAQKHHLQIAVQSGAIAAAYLGEVNSKLNSLDPQNQEFLLKGALFGDRLWDEWAGVYNRDR